MVEKLKLIPLGALCLVVMGFLCTSLNAQSSSQQNSNSSDVDKLTQLIQEEEELTKTPLTNENLQKLEKIQEERIAFQKKLNSNFQLKKTSLENSQGRLNIQQNRMIESDLVEQKKSQLKKVRRSAKPLIVN